MATSNFGTLCAYVSNKEDWQGYVERLELFFTANDINNAAIKQAAVIQGECKPPSKAVSKIEQKISRSQGTKCFRCDNLHNPKSCPFIDKQCFFYGNKGHTSKICRKKAMSNQNHIVKQSSNVVIETIPNDNSEDDVFSIYQLRNWNPSTPITVFITIANHKLAIEVDTGASISLLNWNTFQKLNCESNISLLPTKSKLKTYSGKIVSPKVRLK